MSLARPLEGVRIVEFEGIGPGPVCGYMLEQLGAAVTVIARPGQRDFLARLAIGGPGPAEAGKQRVELDIKTPDGREQALALIASADALIEGLRPGVMERLGIGPADCAAANPKLVYCRLTGWGQSGPLARAAGHDLNYVALTGLLSLGGEPGRKPTVPPTLLGDAAGALGAAFGIAAALLDVARGGPGRVIDAAITDITAMLGVLVQSLHGAGLIDTGNPGPLFGAPFYDVYACADGRCLTIGSIEPEFFAILMGKLGLGDIDPASQYDPATWPALRDRLTALFLEYPRDHWTALLEGTDACFAPVLSMGEAPAHPHNLARGTFGGQGIARGAPRFGPLV